MRILVYSASFGAGHLKAADAIIEAVKEVEPSAEIIHEDFMSHINRVLNSLMKTSYIKLIKRAPKIWGKFYNGTKEATVGSILNSVLNKVGRSKFMKNVETLSPDIIVCTYPTIAGILAQMRLRGELKIPLVTVITDYSVHSQWIHPGVDLYIVGSSQISDGLVERGVNPRLIQASGIPVNPRFDFKADRNKILAKLGLAPDRLTFLIMGGAYGVLDKLKRICQLIGTTSAPLQVIVVCGKDKRLYKSLDSVMREAVNPILRFDYVNNVDELMTAANVIITKAGGLTVTEALTKRLPMIIYKPIPGQEEDNAVFIDEIGAGRVAYTDEEFEEIFYELIKAPDELKRMACAANQLHIYHSADKAVRSILELAQRYSA